MNPGQRQTTPPEPPRRAALRRRTWVFALVAILLALLGGRAALLRVTDPQRLRALTEAYLQDYFNGRVHVGGAELYGFDQIILRNVRLSAADAPSSSARPVSGADQESQPVFSCPRVTLALRWRALLAGRVEIESIAAREPEWTVRRDMDLDRSNLEGLVRAERLRTAHHGARLPRLELRDSRWRIIRAEGGQERVVEDMRLTLRGCACVKDPRWYDVVWTRGDAGGVSGYSQVDLVEGRFRNVRGGLPWMSIEAVAIAVGSHFHHAAVWSDLLGLEGGVRASEYDVDANGATGGRSAIVELNDATLSIPLPGAGQHLPPAERFLHFERVFGTIRVQEDTIRAEFDGTLRGSAGRAVLTLRAAHGHVHSMDDVSLEARLNIQNLLLPRVTPDAPPGEHKFVNFWPELARFYQRFDPRGPVDVEVEVSRRAGADAPLDLHYWMVRARGGEASFVKFPYRLHDVRGIIVGTAGGVWIDRLTARRDGANVEVRGWYSDLTHCSEADIRVSARHVPVDDVLCAALSPRFRSLLQRFQPEGEIDFDVALRRPPCVEVEPMPWDQTVTIYPMGIHARDARFPYPIQDIRGAIVVRDRNMVIPELRGRAGGDGALRVTGRAQFDRDDGEETELTLQAVRVPVDADLLAALPPTVRRQVEAFRPQGTIDARVDLQQKNGARARIQAGIQWHDGTLEHEALPVAVEEISARVQFNGDELRIDDLRGRCGTAAVTGGAILEQLTSEQPAAAMNVTLDGLLLDDALYARIPPSWRHALSGARVYGTLDAGIEARIPSSGGVEPPRWNVAGTIREALVRHPRLPLPVTDVRGDFRIDSTGWTWSGMEGRYGTGRLEVSADVRHGAGMDQGSFRIEAAGLTVDPTLLALIPQADRNDLFRLGLHGRVDVSIPRLEYSRDESGRRTWSFAGDWTLHEIGAHASTGLDGASGVIRSEGTLVEDGGAAMLGGTLQLDQARVKQRELRNVTGRWNFAQAADGRGRLALEEMHGELYGGSVSAEAELSFGPPPAQFRAVLTAFGVDTDQFVNAAWTPRAGREPARIGGFFDARLQLGGTLGDPASLQGGGRLEAFEARVNRWPLILAVLNAINLVPSEQESLVDVSGDLLISGSQVDLKNIELIGPTVSLLGKGAMSWPDLGLDIRLVNVHNERWTRIPGLTDFVERASRELVEVHVTGTAEKPAVRVRPVPGLTDEFRELFQRKKPRRLPSAPS